MGLLDAPANPKSFAAPFLRDHLQSRDFEPIRVPLRSLGDFTAAGGVQVLPLVVLDRPARLVTFEVVALGAAVAQGNGTDNWKFEAMHYRSTTGISIAQQTTQTISLSQYLGVPLVNSDWSSLPPADFLNKDMLALRITPTGAPPNITGLAVNAVLLPGHYADEDLWPYPDPKKAALFIGDTHFQSVTGTGNTTSGSTSVTSVVDAGAAFALGMAISGPGIPAGTVINAVSGGTITLSQQATATATGVALTAHGGGFMSEPRWTIAKRDMAMRHMRGLVRAVVQVGDLVNEDTVSTSHPAVTDTEAVAKMTALATSLGGIPWKAALGNHDLFYRNAATAVAAIGNANVDKNHTLERSVSGLPYRIVIVGPDRMLHAPAIELSATTLTWLGARIAESQALGEPVVVVGHAPIKNTMASTNASDFQSTTTGYWICSEATTADSSDVLAVFAAYPGVVKAYVSGHTHPEFSAQNNTTTGVVTELTVGGAKLVAINCPSPAFNGINASNAQNQMWSTYLALDSTGYEVRFRNHSLHMWDAIHDATLSATAIRRTVWRGTWT